MARTHTQINAQKTHTHRCRRSPAIKRSMPAPRGSGCVSGPWQTNSCWTHGSYFSPTVDRSGYLWETSLGPSRYRSANPLWASAESVYLRQGTKTPLDTSSCDSSAGSGAALSFGCSYTGKNIIHMFYINAWLASSFFCFLFFSRLGVSLLFYSCGWHWRMIFKSELCTEMSNMFFQWLGM